MKRYFSRSHQIQFLFGGILLFVVFLFFFDSDVEVEKFQDFILQRNVLPTDSGAEVLEKEEKRSRAERKAAWFQTQWQRRRAINETCSSIDRKVLLETIYETKESRKYLLYDDCHKAIYCAVPKVARSSWRKAWMLLSRMSFNVTGIGEDKIEEAFKERTMRDIQNRDDLKYRLTNYKKIIVVRHPVERLLAVFLDDVHNPALGSHVLPRVRQTRPEATIANISWPEFVQYIISEGVIDSQLLLPYEDVCHPCAIDYDFVVTLETFKEDSDNVVELLGGSKSERVQLSPIEEPLDGARVKAFVDSLSATELKALKSKYRRDMKMFHYS
ncbi:carbohydrate sulfotransferase 11-like [Macrobrachium nipponense]|uniref:carbohydrate sulfotransferase 11-like n=1 Tax=Macrobrachium nipponense TaxID=159736 RepID=UPI0030C7A482